MVPAPDGVPAVRDGFRGGEEETSKGDLEEDGGEEDVVWSYLRNEAVAYDAEVLGFVGRFGLAPRVTFAVLSP